MDSWRARSRRWVGLLGVTGVLAAGLLGCARQTAAPAPDRPSAAPTRTFDRAHIATGPATAEIGRRYPYDLYVHCAGEYTLFGGITWRTDTPPGAVIPSPDSKGLGAVRSVVSIGERTCVL